VELIKTVEGKAPAGFANAVLRKISALRSSEISEEELDRSLPEWIQTSLRKSYGDLWTREFARASLQRPDLWIRTRDADQNVNMAERGPFAGCWKLEDFHQLSSVEGFEHGKVLVQNLSSQTLVREISARIREVSKSKLEVLDLCAAPGGKAIGLSWEGWKVVATDENSQRLSWLKTNTGSMAPEVQCIPYADRFSQAWDWIWVDAPCSGTGTLRRHPEIRWIRGEKELQSLIEIQKKLIHEAWEHLKSGGFLTYSVCSVLKDECEKILATLPKGAELLGEWNMAPHLAPHGDGFLGALLRKH
jgi:16S rRNA (cytosine967-C5)-methyltransferase